MATGNSLALWEASKVFAGVMRRLAASVMRSPKTAAAVNVQRVDANTMAVNAGYPTPYGGEHGPWGWEPITAWMFETGARHPFYGHAPWYAQPYRPILNRTVEAGYSSALEVYGNVRSRELAVEFGYR